MRAKGVEEHRIGVDAALQLGDDASAVKMAYSVLHRWDVLRLLSVGSDIIDLHGLGVDKEDPAAVTGKLKEMLQKDEFLNENATNAMPYMSLRDPTTAFQACQSVDELTALETDLMNAFKHLKVVASAVKKSFKAPAP